MDKERTPKKLSETIRPQRKLSDITGSIRDFPFDTRRSEELRTDRQAFLYVKERFESSLEPLVESYRKDPRVSDEINRTLSQEELPDLPIFNSKKIEEFEKQRKLSKIEKDYFASTELLASFGPYLTAIARADIDSTNAYLQNYFERLSKTTVESLRNGDYFPLILIGLGPNGLIAMGEIVRKNPKLASQTLIVDQGEQPGGPFAIPNGPAWELNSANLIGKRKMLPDLPAKNEEKTVRSYGSPDRWYPGERTKERNDTRSGSINKLIDWLPDPDDFSNRRYPTNEELEIILLLQASVTVKQLALKTRVLSVEPIAQKGEEQGNKLLTLEISNYDNPTARIVKVRTDSLIVASGLGEPYYGFDTRGKRAERVIEESKKQEGFAKITTPLEAFRSLADRARKEPNTGIGETIAIYGIGDSALTLLEYLGRDFKGEINPDVRNIEKIYILATKDPSRRPRYARICDLLSRGRRGNVVTTIKSRVADFDFDSTGVPIEKRKVILFDKDNNPITDERGRILKVDNVIAATGFRSTLDRVFSAYLKPGENLKDRLRAFTLPTNPNVSVAEALLDDPSVLFVGTASVPRFNREKLSQLPRGARNELKRVGSENLVAIGFRGPDTQAAVNIFLS